MDKPNIKLFRTENHYVYDVNTNRIMEISKETYVYLFKLCSNGSSERYEPPDQLDLTHEENTKAQAEIENIKKDPTLLLPNKISDFGFFKTEEEIRDTLSNQLEQLTLEITQSCNLRCSYCTYGGDHKHQRTHSNAVMSDKVIDQAIDFFFERNTKTKKVSVGFYGGEPLLHYDKVKYAIERTRKYNRKGQEVNLQLTTNGYLLNDEMIDYFAENEVTYWISFDGSKETNDLNRRTAEGHGTAERTFENVEKIISRYPEYARDNLFFNQVIVENHDIRDFFENNILSKISAKPPYNFALGFVDRPEDVQEVETHKNYKRDLHNYYVTYIQNLIADADLDEMTMEGALIDRLWGSELFTLITRSFVCQKQNYARGMCIPGARKTYVDVHGDIHICEKINNKLPIGNVFDGFNYEAVLNIMNLFAETKKEECLDCWIVRMCPVCIAPLWSDKEIDGNIFDDVCKSTKDMCSENLTTFCAILEKNGKAFDKKLHQFIVGRISEKIEAGEADEAGIAQLLDDPEVAEVIRKELGIRCLSDVIR